jgi:3-oxoacyl-(acyl-carrier-protein) synthase
MSGDAYHMTGMAPEGEGCRRAMNAALKVAGISPDKIDYVNAHATSTPLGDALESQAIENVFGERAKNHTLLVSSTKSMTGHLLGGAGGLEAGITIMALLNQIVPPTMNLENVDPACRYNTEPIKGPATAGPLPSLHTFSQHSCLCALCRILNNRSIDHYGIFHSRQREQYGYRNLLRGPRHR